MIYLDLPTINGAGTVEQQLSEIRSYIYRSNEQLNASLSNLTVDKIWEQTASALSVSNGNNEEKADMLTKYQKLRDLVIKTADIIMQTDEQWQMTMNGSFLAKSQFGEYLLNTSVQIDGKSTGFLQLYTSSSELKTDYGNYKTYQQNFIKQGLLDDTGETPIYGIDIGLLTNEFTVTDEDGTTTVTVDSNKKMRITPGRLSLFDDDKETAYIEKGAINFPEANITGGSININNNFKVDSNGNLTAKTGNYSGDIEASSLVASWNRWSNGGIKLENSQINTYYEGEQIFSISPNKLTFYKLYTEGSSAEIADVQRLNYGNHSGLGINLNGATGSFFTVGVKYDNNPQFTPRVTYSQGPVPNVSGDNIYKDWGLHIETPCDFHNNIIKNAKLSDVNFSEQITSNGQKTKSGTTSILVRNSSGAEFWTTFRIENGLIVGIHESAFL